MTNIKIQKSANVGEIILNSPQTLNLIEIDTFDAIGSAIDDFEADNSIKAILLRAVCGISRKSGKKIFSAGVNLKKYENKLELYRKNPEIFKKNLIKNRQLPYKIEQISTPFVFGCNGFVTGGFFELALFCDAVLVSKSASFSLNEVNVGLVPGYGGVNGLLKLVGKQKTFDIAATGRHIDAEEAINLGIAVKMLDDEDFEAQALKYCQNLPPNAVIIKDTIKNILNGEDVGETEVNSFIRAISQVERIRE